MTKVFDPGFGQKLLHILQARGTSPSVEDDLSVLGLVISIPAADVLENAARAPSGFEIVTLANPAAGADWSFTVPSDRIWVPYLLSATLTTSAAVANRGPRLRVLNESAVFVAFASAPKQSDSAHALQPASEANVWSWAKGIGGATLMNAGDNYHQQTLGDLALLPGWRLDVNTLVLQAGDQWSAIIMQVQSLRVV